MLSLPNLHKCLLNLLRTFSWREAFLHILDTWELKLSLKSKVTPKSLTSSSHFIVISLILNSILCFLCFRTYSYCLKLLRISLHFIYGKPVDEYWAIILKIFLNFIYIFICPRECIIICIIIQVTFFYEIEDIIYKNIK